MPKTHLNPDSMAKNPAFSQAVVVTEPKATIYVGGQNGVDADGSVVEGGLYEQAKQAFLNLQTVLAAADAELTDVVHWRVAVVEGEDVRDGLRAFQEVWGTKPDPPAISVHAVGMANPAFLCEIDAVAVT